MPFNFEKLDVYREAIEFAKRTYAATEKFPTREQFGLISQIRRANIAEGSGRFHKRDFQQFIRMSRSSIYECVALLKLSNELKYLESQEYESLYQQANKIAKMLNGLINSLEKGEK